MRDDLELYVKWLLACLRACSSAQGTSSGDDDDVVVVFVRHHTYARGGAHQQTWRKQNTNAQMPIHTHGLFLYCLPRKRNKNRKLPYSI